MTKFRAAILDAPKTPLRIGDVELEALRSTDVLVRLGASGFCHTDLEVIDGSLTRPMPVVLGHEGAGTVEAVGSGVRRVRPGDHVICSWNPACRQCYYCVRAQRILCEPVGKWHPRGKLLDGQTRLTHQGRPLHHFSMVSSHAEYCVVPEAGAIQVGRDIPFDRACLIGCGVMTGYAAATRLACITPGAEVAVIGAGAVGLNVIQGAVARDAGRIFAIDTNPLQLEQAKTFGATDTVCASGIEAIEHVRSATSGRGAEFVFEAAGKAGAMQLALECARPGGQVVLLGKIPVDAVLELRFGALWGEKRIIRSSYGGANPETDFPALAEAYMNGRLKLDELIGQRLCLDDINLAVDRMRAGQPGRSVVVFPQ
jgi:S-(hydroxymethyl)glutathione dehydrogenase / alcohol dehydrogenase